ncbi:MAG: phenylalanine--tRNA ligase subunit alpha, partial [Candidatus Omnitrophica bacterium]|nr:phenylalanine--tRNA ligase subunit alpha [Candidatus Omnitrophota bacterium]
MIERLKEIEQSALKEIESSADKDSLEKIRIKYLGRNGILTEIFKNIGKLP